MPPADHLTAEHPDMVAVTAQGLIRESLAQQLVQKGLEEFDDVLPDHDIVVIALPSARPLGQVRTESVEICLITGLC